MRDSIFDKSEFNPKKNKMYITYQPIKIKKINFYSVEKPKKIKRTHFNSDRNSGFSIENLVFRSSIFLIFNYKKVLKETKNL